MKITQKVTVGGVEFEMRKREVMVSPPAPEKPTRYYSNFNPVSREDLEPLCRAIEGCWPNADFVEQLINRGQGSCQSYTGFDFHKPGEQYDYTPTVRIDLEPGERGVLTHCFEEDAEASVTFFVNLTIAYGEFCIANEVSVHHTSEDIERIRQAFRIDSASRDRLRL